MWVDVCCVAYPEFVVYKGAQGTSISSVYDFVPRFMRARAPVVYVYTLPVPFVVFKLPHVRLVAFQLYIPTYVQMLNEEKDSLMTVTIVVRYMNM